MDYKKEIIKLLDKIDNGNTSTLKYIYTVINAYLKSRGF